jgi:siroheme synthase (precorrin-2 oxidase/ferrochelatase)
VVTCTSVPEINEAVAQAARETGALVARADDAAGSDVLWTARRRIGPLEVAVGSGGLAPALTGWAADRLGESLEDVLGADADTLVEAAELLAEVRAEWRSTVGDNPAGRSESPNWRSAVDRSMLEMISRGQRARAKERLQTCRSSS